MEDSLMGKTKYEAMEEKLTRGWRKKQRELPREKRERTYFAMKQSESLNEWIERIRQTRAAGKSFGGGDGGGTL